MLEEIYHHPASPDHSLFKDDQYLPPQQLPHAPPVTGPRTPLKSRRRVGSSTTVSPACHFPNEEILLPKCGNPTKNDVVLREPPSQIYESPKFGVKKNNRKRIALSDDKENYHQVVHQHDGTNTGIKKSNLIAGTLKNSEAYNYQKTFNNQTQKKTDSKKTTRIPSKEKKTLPVTQQKTYKENTYQKGTNNSNEKNSFKGQTQNMLAASKIRNATIHRVHYEQQQAKIEQGCYEEGYYNRKPFESNKQEKKYKITPTKPSKQHEAITDLYAELTMDSIKKMNDGLDETESPKMEIVNEPLVHEVNCVKPIEGCKSIVHDSKLIEDPNKYVAQQEVVNNIKNMRKLRKLQRAMEGVKETNQHRYAMQSTTQRQQGDNTSTRELKRLKAASTNNLNKLIMYASAMYQLKNNLDNLIYNMNESYEQLLGGHNFSWCTEDIKLQLQQELEPAQMELSSHLQNIIAIENNMIEHVEFYVEKVNKQLRKLPNFGSTAAVMQYFDRQRHPNIASYLVKRHNASDIVLNKNHYAETRKRSISSPFGNGKMNSSDIHVQFPDTTSPISSSNSRVLYPASPSSHKSTYQSPQIYSPFVFGSHEHVAVAQQQLMTGHACQMLPSFPALVNIAVNNTPFDLETRNALLNSSTEMFDEQTNQGNVYNDPKTFELFQRQNTIREICKLAIKINSLEPCPLIQCYHQPFEKLISVFRSCRTAHDNVVRQLYLSLRARRMSTMVKRTITTGPSPLNQRVAPSTTLVR